MVWLSETAAKEGGGGVQVSGVGGGETLIVTTETEMLKTKIHTPTGQKKNKKKKKTVTQENIHSGQKKRPQATPFTRRDRRETRRLRRADGGK